MKKNNTQYLIPNTQYPINGHTRLVGIIGWPVRHSLSPRMHNAAYAALGLDWAYVPLPVPPEYLAEAVHGLAALGFAGTNVTIPHKQAVIPFMDELTPIARAIGAVNTIVVRPDGSLLGDSTDGCGFMTDLWAHGVTVGESTNGESRWEAMRLQIETPRVPASPCRRVLALGAGGAARAVVYALAEAGATVTVVNRTLDKAQEICQTIGAALTFTAVRQSAQKKVGGLSVRRDSAVAASTVRSATQRLSAHPFPEALAGLAAEADLIINTTSLGLHEGDPLPWDAAIPFRPGQVVYDLIYNRPTELLALTRSQGATALNGLGMLTNQGACSAALWTGKNAVELAYLMRKEILGS